MRETDPATGRLERFATPLFLALVLVEFVDLISGDVLVSLWKARGQPVVREAT